MHLRAAHRVDCDVFALEQRIERDVAIAPSEIDTSAVAFVPQPKGAAGINPDFNSCAQVCAASCGDRRNVARGALREWKSIATSQKEPCTNGVRGVGCARDRTRELACGQSVGQNPREKKGLKDDLREIVAAGSTSGSRGGPPARPP